MTFKIRMLTAAAVLALPAAAGAQVSVSTGATGQVTAPQPTMDQVNQTVQEVEDEATRTAHESQGTVDETVRRTEETVEQTADEAADTASEAADTANTSAESAADTAANTPPVNADAQANAEVGAQAQAGPVVAATAADVTAGAAVRDSQGGEVGTIESVDADSAIVSTGSVRADIPIGSFGKNGQGLVLAITRAQLEAQAQAARTPTS